MKHILYMDYRKMLLASRSNPWIKETRAPEWLVCDCKHPEREGLMGVDVFHYTELARKLLKL